MKNLLKASVLIILCIGLTACSRKSDSPEAQTNIQNSHNQDPTVVSRILISEKGDTIFLTYFAKDDEIGVRLKVNGEERELDAKGSSEKGNPVFSDGEYGWEMFVDGRSGRLFTPDSEGKLFRER
ncbi:MAG: hypothetical protein PHO74_03470 [Weeksellaceae bacterium]|nr:hypothetical protein [Weeksellaceae bacterium]